MGWIDDTSTLVQVMVWSHYAMSHYLSQCWPRSMSPYGVTGHDELKQIERLHSEIPPATPWLPILVNQSQSYKFKKIANNSNFEILQETLYETHLLKLLDKMYKYEMDPIRIVDATERTQNAGRMDRRTEWNQYTTTSLLCRGIINFSGSLKESPLLKPPLDLRHGWIITSHNF